MNRYEQSIKNLEKCVVSVKRGEHSLDLGSRLSEGLASKQAIKDAYARCYRSYGNTQMEAMLSALEANLKSFNLRYPKTFFTPVGDIKALTRESVENHAVVYGLFRVVYSNIYMTHHLSKALEEVNIGFNVPTDHYPYLTYRLASLDVPQDVLQLAQTFHENPLIANGNHLDPVAKGALIQAIANLKRGFNGFGGGKNPRILLPTDPEALYLIRMSRHYQAMLSGLFCRNQVSEYHKRIEEIANMHAFIKIGIAALDLALGGISVTGQAATVKSGASGVVSRGLTSKNEKIKGEHQAITNSLHFQNFKRYLDDSKAKLNAAMLSGSFTYDTKIQMCRDMADDLYNEAEAWYRATEDDLKRVRQIEKLEQENEMIKRALEKHGIKLNSIIHDSHSRFYAQFKETLKQEKYYSLNDGGRTGTLSTSQMEDLANLWAAMSS
jgi:hypothetical protein